jgi:hypothetical protein
MENINFTKSPTPKLTNSNEKITPQGTLEVKSRKKIGPAEYQAEKLRTQTYENRLEAEKNSEMIREKLKGVSASLNLDMRIQ